MATQLWARHIGLNQVRLANCEIVTLQTDNFNPFFEVTRKDNRGDRACLWIIEQIKKLLGCYPEWENRIKYVAKSSNRAAHYLEAVGLNNWNTMHYFLEPFGCLQEKLDLDMGFGPPIFQRQVSPIPLDPHGFIAGFAPPNITLSAKQEDASDNLSINGGHKGDSAVGAA